jgi:acetylornithine/N-succinyldiaminopimelate aminotransferase
VLAALSPAALARARRVAAGMRREIESWRATMPFLVDVRGAGHMLGLELDRPGADLVTRARENGLLINCTADRVLRLLPPLILTEAEARRGLALLKKTLKDYFLPHERKKS